MAVKSYALTTRQRLMDFMGLSSVTSTQGNVLDRIIDAVTEYIQDYCGTRFKKTTYTNEVYNSSGNGVIVLKNKPVISSESISVEIGEHNDYNSLNSDYYVIDYDAGVLRTLVDTTLRRGVATLRVSYTAGYDYDNVTTFLSDTEAGAIEYACWKLCAAAYNNRKQSQGVRSESLGDYAVTFQRTSFEDDEVASILDKYASLGLGGTLGVTSF